MISPSRRGYPLQGGKRADRGAPGTPGGPALSIKSHGRAPNRPSFVQLGFMDALPSCHANKEADMKRTALTLGALAAMALLSGCAADGYDSAYYGGGGGGYYGGYYDGYY